MKPNYCPFCQKETDPSDVFCPYCGKKRPEENESVPETPKESENASEAPEERTDDLSLLRPPAADPDHAREDNVIPPPLREDRDFTVPGSPPPVAYPPPVFSDGEEKSDPKKTKLTLLAAAAGLIAVAAFVAAFLIPHIFPKETEGAAQTTAVEEETTHVPSTVQEIADFYSYAVALARSKRQPAYVKKTWQEPTVIDITGNETIDSWLSSTVYDKLTTEDDAEEKTVAGGTMSSKNEFPEFTLTDYSKIRTASCEASGDEYHIRLVMENESSPLYEDSFLGQVSNAVIYYDTDLLPCLDGIRKVSAYEGVSIDYTDYTIDAVIKMNGDFVALEHTADASIDIEEVDIFLIPIDNVHIGLSIRDTYQNFVY